MSAAIRARSLSVRRGNAAVVSGISIDLPVGHCLGVIGPNGSGKTSLLLGLRGLLPSEGELALGGIDPRRSARGDVVQRVAVVPQRNEFAFSNRVDEMVLLGRSPYRRPWQGWSETDRSIVGTWLECLGLSALADRPVDALSGGERRKVFLARALVQETPILFLDEPFAGLDPAAQEELASLLSALRREGTRTMVLVLHDVARVPTLCDAVLGLADGAMRLSGPPGEELTAEALEGLYGVSWTVATREDGERLLVPRGRLPGASPDGGAP